MSERFTPLATAPRAIITGIEITRHRLHFGPPFQASWDTKPRTFWDAAIVQVHTDLGVTGVGSGDMMLGFEGHEHLVEGASFGGGGECLGHLDGTDGAQRREIELGTLPEVFGDGAEQGALFWGGAAIDVDGPEQRSDHGLDPIGGETQRHGG